MPPDAAITIEPSKADEREAVRFIEALQRELGMSTTDAVSWAAYYVAVSAGASTKKAKKTRPLLKNRGKDPDFHPLAFPTYVKAWHHDGMRPHFIAAGEELTDKFRTVALAGLAKDSWQWIIRDIGRRSKRTGNAPMPKAYRVTKEGGLNPAVMMTNRLGYILDAIRQGGEMGIETAVERGMRGGFKYLEGRTGRALA